MTSLTTTLGGGKRKRGAPTIALPNYDSAVQVDSNGCAILPSNFLPVMLDKVPDDWYPSTFQYMPYFDSRQRDGEGNVVADDDLGVPTAANIGAWKTLIGRFLYCDFKEESKFYYGKEIGLMATLDEASSEGFEEGRPAETPELALNALFKIVTPHCLENDDMNRAVAFIWKWFYVPSLETNNQWVKDGLDEIFRRRKAKVVLDDVKSKGTRVHSIIRHFKKYGTQSTLRTLKLRMERTFGWVLEVTKHRDKEGELPECKEGWIYTRHDIGPHLTGSLKSMMRRNGGMEFLVRHEYKVLDVGKQLTSDLRGW